MIWSFRTAAFSTAGLLALAPTLAFAQAGQPAGRLVLATGAVQVIRAGATLQGRMGVEIRPGDTIRTAPKSRAQLWLRDGSMVSIRDNSEYRLDAYSYRPEAPASGASNVSSIVKGGARFLSGALAKANPKAVQVNTRVATIGIRGTGYDLIDCIDQCFDEAGVAAKPGLYGSVYEGLIVVTNDAGQSEVLKTQSFYIAGQQNGLLLLPTQPNFLAEPVTSEGSGKSTTDVEPVDVPVDAPAVGTSQVSTVPSDKIANIPAPPPQQIDTLTTPEVILSGPGAGNNIALSATAANYTLMSAEYNPATREQNVQNIIKNVNVSSTAGQIDMIKAPLFPNFPGYVIRGYTARFQEGGSDNGTIAWGRWADGTALIGGWSGTVASPTPISLTASQGFHWIIGEPARTLPSAGIYTFSLIGATIPTETRADSQLGWSVTGGSLTADLTNAKISGQMTLYLARSEGYGYFDMKFGSNGTIAAGIPTQLDINVTRLNGSASICTASCGGVGQLLFFGNDPARPAQQAGMTYNFNIDTYLVAGAAAFRR
ncbi:MAG: hypothetical protein RL425_896 [Pseudomonadota bacterium]